MKTIKTLVNEYKELSMEELDNKTIIPDDGWHEPTDPNTIEYRRYMASIEVMADNGCF